MKWILVSAFASSAAGFVLDKDRQYSGVATDLYSGQFYYSEEHQEWKDADKLSKSIIAFKDIHHHIIVTKKIDYSKNAIGPNFIQEDLRDGYMEAVTAKGEFTELKYRKNARRKMEVRCLKIPEPVVVDGGFNNFVKDHWDELLAGNVIRFNFAIPSQLDYFVFRVSYLTEKELSGKKVIVFKMEPDKFILRTLISPVILTYNVSTRRLMQYEGLSTINDTNGKSYNVKIVFPQNGP